jgi:peptide/nickel transport system substrate-binding protein/oligopeptide transport system substrate-binding protein
MRTSSDAALSGRRNGLRLSHSGAARLLLLLAGFVPLLLAGCTPQGPNGTPLAQNQVLTWPLSASTNVDKASISNSEMLDPASVSFYADVATINMVYVGLVRFDSNLNAQPDAASALPDIDSSGKVYTFHLRPGMTFSDGQPLQAKDFAYSIDRALDPTLCTVQDATVYKTDGSTVQCDDSLGKAYLGHILGAIERHKGIISSMIANGDDPNKGLSVIDPLTLKIRLDAPISYFLQTLGYPTSYAVEQSFIAKYPGGAWVNHLDSGGCSGPFKVKSYGDGSTMTLEPSTNWETVWGKHITLTQVVRPLMTDGNVEYTNYRQGQYDYTDVPQNNYDTAHSQSDFAQIPTLSTRYFGLNWKVAPFDNLQVRQAFSLALNKQLLVDTIEHGGGIPTNHIVPQGMPGFNPALLTPPPDKTQSITGNQKAAQDLLSQAKATCPAPGFFIDKPHTYCKYITGSNPLEIDIWARPNGLFPWQDITRAAADQWGQVLGLNVKYQQIDRNHLFGHILGTDPKTGINTNDLPIWGAGWLADYADPQDFLSLQFASGQGYNASQVSDSGLDQLLNKADVELDQTKRLQDYYQAEQFASDYVAWIPFQQDIFYWRQRSWVHGFSLNSLQQIPDVNWANVTILEH